ncbi:WD40 repeat-like protein [Auriscalpium vulgare]|uniref:WD40 repeat-like protein n=1 Tax=Auriscalpium vulgare TaxID=40419 RepID=A0ACB8RGD6_9AGAM|nr:WD40 repeat-like protein [Auriscalpium vulgare]
MDVDDDRDEDEGKEDRDVSGAIERSLAEICLAVREASADDALSAADLHSLVEKAAEKENEIVTADYNEADLHDFIPAYCGNNVTDGSVGLLGAGKSTQTMQLFQKVILQIFAANANADAAQKLAVLKAELGGTSITPYDPSSKPSANTTPLARFVSNRPEIPESASPALRAFAEARCEIMLDNLTVPINVQLAGNMLAVQGAGGWKNRDPMLHLYLLDDPEDDGFGTFESVEVGLDDVARHMEMDASRSLVYVSDGSRIKSYRWNVTEGRNALAVHTLNASGFKGPLALRDNGAKLIASGSSGLAVWDVDTLPTHGTKGNKIVGKKRRADYIDSWRDNDDNNIELSTGAPPTQRSSASALSKIKQWAMSPGGGNEMIVTYDEQYFVSRVDLQTEQIVGRYIGHGAHVASIRTSQEDPHAFVTAANDGIVRLYDVRQPVPVLAIEHSTEFINDALFEHIGGQPFIIFGGTQTQQVKVWDARAKLPLYELSTGNNEVNGLAWDAQRQTLYAATECEHVDRMGRHHGYRRAKLPKPPRHSRDDDGDDDMEEDEEDEDDWDGDGENNWPEQAYHSETSFGHLLDSAEHRLYRYAFKTDADIDLRPASGYSAIGDSYAQIMC